MNSPRMESSPELMTLEHPHQGGEVYQGPSFNPETSKVADNENAVYILPNIFNSEEDDPNTVVVAVNPHNGGFKASERFRNGLQEDLEVEVQEVTMPMTFVDDKGRILNPLSNNPSEEQKIDDMIVGEKPGKIGGWFGYVVSGERQMIHDPNLPKYIGALVARELEELNNETDELWLEDVTERRPHFIKLVGEEVNLAKDITDEHKVENLDQAIVEDRNRISNKAKRAATYIVSKVVEPVSAINDRLVYR